MTNKNKFIFLSFGVFIWVTILFFTVWWSYRKGYEKCAIDFYQGRMKVNLIKKSDGTKE